MSDTLISEPPRGTIMTPSETKAFNIGTVWLPMGMVVAIASALVWFTWSASAERVNINNRIDTLSVSVQSLANSVKSIVERAGTPDASVVTRSQFIIDCLQMQVLNPSWRCPYGVQRQDWSTLEVPLQPGERYALRP